MSTYDISEEHTKYLSRTGFNGWVNFDLKKYHFCARCNHLEWVKPFTYYDGRKETPLEGMYGNPYDSYEDGGAKVSYSVDLYDIYFWAAIKFGWYQFINDRVNPDLMNLHIKFVGPEDYLGAREFVDLWGVKSHHFKADHQWPEKDPRAAPVNQRRYML